jgi:hypothetical protein
MFADMQWISALKPSRFLYKSCFWYLHLQVIPREAGLEKAIKQHISVAFKVLSGLKVLESRHERPAFQKLYARVRLLDHDLCTAMQAETFSSRLQKTAER